MKIDLTFLHYIYLGFYIIKYSIKQKHFTIQIRFGFGNLNFFFFSFTLMREALNN